MNVSVPTAVLRHAATAVAAATGALLVAAFLGSGGDGAPDAVRSVVARHGGDAAVRSLEAEREQGRLVWAAEWEADGREHEIKVTPEGDVVEHETEWEPAEVPAPVREAAARVAGGRIVEWARKTVTVYEATALVNGRDRDIEVLATGVLLGAARPDDDDGDDDESEEEIPLDQVPEVVMAAALRALPGAVFEEAERELERDRVVYELEGTHEGEAVEIELTEDGEVLEIERGDDDD